MSNKQTISTPSSSKIQKPLPTSPTQAYKPFIALHVGAGCHSKESAKRLQKLCKKVINEGLDSLAIPDPNYNPNSKLNAQKSTTTNTQNEFNHNIQISGNQTVKNSTAFYCAVEACKKLENNPYTNAGFGSPLNEEGFVECDASIMTSVNKIGNMERTGKMSEILKDNAKRTERIRNGLGASVACCTTAKNPIQVAAALLQSLLQDFEQCDRKDDHNQQEKGYLDKHSIVNFSDPLGRVKPSMLVGRGADVYSRKRGCEQLTSDTGLISTSSLRSYLQWKKFLSVNTRKRKREDGVEGQGENEDKEKEIKHTGDEVQDTVGVICGDIYGNIVACVSSGGTALKPVGRIGPAGLLGSGVQLAQAWSNGSGDDSEGSNDSRNNLTCAVCTTGTGEDIVACQFASCLVQRLLQQRLGQNAENREEEDRNQDQDGVDNKWIQETLATPYSYTLQRVPFYAGFLSVVADNGLIEIKLATTTENMVGGYGVGRGKDDNGNEKKKCQVVLLENPGVGTLATQGFGFSVNTSEKD